MALRAVVFDYGRVLTGPPATIPFNNILKITGLTEERLLAPYWANRQAYDSGKLTGLQYWQKICAETGLKLTDEQINDLNDSDAWMWTTENLPILAWQQELKKKGFLTAILSNMGDHVHQRISNEFHWFSRFDLLVWSYQLGAAKPDPAIYLHTLEKLNVMPQEALFLDDKLPNIEAANALGIKGILFTDVDKLRADLVSFGLDMELPMP